MSKRPIFAQSAIQTTVAFHLSTGNNIFIEEKEENTEMLFGRQCKARAGSGQREERLQHWRLYNRPCGTEPGRPVLES